CLIPSSAQPLAKSIGRKPSTARRCDPEIHAGYRQDQSRDIALRGLLSRRDYQGLRTLSGAAPVTKRSGKSLIVVRRYAAHVRLRNTVYHWARVATQRDPRCRARYTALRKRGHSHGRALRGVADRLLALVCVLLQRQTLFDPYFGRPAA